MCDLCDLIVLISIGYGITTDGTTVFVNCSVCTFNYKPINSPVIFDLPNSLSQ